MPSMGDLAIARRLRAGGSSNAVLVAMAAYDTEQARFQVWEARFQAHWTKPVEPEQIRSILRRCVAPGV